MSAFPVKDTSVCIFFHLLIYLPSEVSLQFNLNPYLSLQQKYLPYYQPHSRLFISHPSPAASSYWILLPCHQPRIRRFSYPYLRHLLIRPYVLGAALADMHLCPYSSRLLWTFPLSKLSCSPILRPVATGSSQLAYPSSPVRCFTYPHRALPLTRPTYAS